MSFVGRLSFSLEGPFNSLCSQHDTYIFDPLLTLFSVIVFSVSSSAQENPSTESREKIHNLHDHQQHMDKKVSTSMSRENNNHHAKILQCSNVGPRESALIRGALIRGVLIRGVLIRGVLIRGVLISGVNTVELPNVGPKGYYWDLERMSRENMCSLERLLL